LNKKTVNIIFVFLLTFVIFSFNLFISKEKKERDFFEITNLNISKTQPPFYNAIYISKNENILRSRNKVSFDNGITWKVNEINISELEKVPSFSRRSPVTSLFDCQKNRLLTFFIALDDSTVAKDAREPVEGQRSYYLRYRVSNEKVDSWLFDKPIFSSLEKYSPMNPFEDIQIGINAFYLGDLGSKAIVSHKGEIYLPAQASLAPSKNTKLNKNKLYNPGGGHTYTDVIILKGKWNSQNSISWTMAARIKGDSTRSTRGLIEPTMVQLKNKKFLVIMRGSNGGSKDPIHKLESFKWFSVSKNGKSWTNPCPLVFDDNSKMYSPSSMSNLFMHSNGKCYLIGNVSKENAKGNSPRFPLVICEVNQKTYKIVRSSLTILDDFKSEDKDKGELDLGHASVFEDRVTKELVIVYPRIYGVESERDWVTMRVKCI
jgi:hypothetical protein